MLMLKDNIGESEGIGIIFQCQSTKLMNKSIILDKLHKSIFFYFALVYKNLVMTYIHIIYGEKYLKNKIITSYLTIN